MHLRLLKMGCLYSRTSNLDYPNSEADEDYWFKVQEIIITSSFIIISARVLYTFIDFVRQLAVS